MIDLKENFRINDIRCLVIPLVLCLILTTSPAGAEWVSAVPGSPPGIINVSLLEETSNHLTIRWDISGFYSKDISTPEGSFRTINFSEASDPTASQLGTPFLPLLVDFIRIPKGLDATVEVIDAKWIDIGDYRVSPRQAPRRATDPKLPEFAYDEQAYSSNELLPRNNADVGNLQGWGGLPVTGVSVTPFRYTPSTGNLQVAQSITVRVEFAGQGRDIIESRHGYSRRFEKLYQNVLLNPPPQADLLDADENEPIRMLFIMREEAQETAEPLIDFHYRTGLNPDVWIVDEDVETQDIKDRLAEDFQDGLEYVFIIGDHPDVPMFHWDPEDDPGPEDPPNDSHSDSWFVCLDGPDQDGFDDHLPDLSIARLAFNDDEIDELEVQVDKLMNYLNWTFEDPDDWGWLETGILVAHYERFTMNGERARWYEVAKENIRVHEYRLPHPDFVPFYGNEQDMTNEIVIDFINEEGTGLFNYRGHGNTTTWARWNRHNQSWGVSQVRRLENLNRPFVLIASACLNANIVELGNCLLDRFQKHTDGGSVCAHGSVVSTYTKGNSYFDIALFRAFYDDGVFALGDANAQTITELVLTYDQDDWPVIGRLNARSYIWLGDPALEIRDSEPMELSVEFFPLPQPGDEVLSARIFGDDEPLPGARLCIRLEDPEIYMAAVTDGDGRVTFDLDAEMEGGWLFDFTAYHRNGIPEDGVVGVADGAGIVQGVVSELGDDLVIEGATVTIQPFDVGAITDVEGFYSFEGVPSLEISVTATAPGYLTAEAVGQVRDEEILELNLELPYARLAWDSSAVTQHLEAGESISRDITIHNSGNGTLIWNSELYMRGENAPFSEYDQFDVYEEVDDSRLHGVEFIDDHYYVAGGNNLRDPNLIYVLDRDGNQVREFYQPEEAAGLGLRDLAWDGDYLYGSSNSSTIFRMNLNGEVEGTIEGPYSPNKALAIDPDGNLWVGKDRENLILISNEGTEISSLDNDLDVTALAWYPQASDGYHLLMFVRNGGAGALLYMANPESGDIVFAADLTRENDYVAGYGLSVANDIEAASWHLVGMVENGAERLLSTWNLGIFSDWISNEQIQGELEPDQQTELTIVFETHDYDNVRLEAEIVFTNNGRVPSDTLAIMLEIGAVGVNDEDVPRALPESFQVGDAFPNPFNDKTVLPVSLPISGRLEVTMYDLQGRLVKLVTDEVYNAGVHRLAVDAGGLSTGVYLLQIRTEGVEHITKIVLMR